jgi:hypothetical protein
VDELLKAGVFPSLLGEIGCSGHPPEALRALLAWARDDNPEKPGGLFIARLRAGARPPEQFSHPPCPRCGGVSEHAESCYLRYISLADLERGTDPTDLEWGVSPDDLERGDSPADLERGTNPDDLERGTQRDEWED